MSLSSFKLKRQLRRLRSHATEDFRGSEEGSVDEAPRPQPVGFGDASLQNVRNRALFKWVITTAGLMAFIFAVLSVYWGSLFHINANVASIAVLIVDFDGLSP
jgi:hypothetical protein